MSKAVADMYDTGVLVENPIYANKYFQQRMGYVNPDKQSTAMVETTQNGFQAKWRGQTFDKRELVAGLHNGEMPGSETNTDVLQARAMNPWAPKATSRLDYINPSWQANVSQYGGNTGTIEMLAGNYSQPLPIAMDNLEQISANAIDEDKRMKQNDPLSNTYALKHMGLEELLAIDRGRRLAEVRGRDSTMQDVTIDISRQDLQNSYNTTYQGPSIKSLTSFLNNPIYERTRRDRRFMSRSNEFNVRRRNINPADISSSVRTVSMNLNQGVNLNVADKVSEKTMAERKIAHQELMSRANKRLNTSRKNTGSEIMFSTPAPIGGISAEDEQLYERRRAEFLREGIGSSQATEAYDTMRPVSFEMPNRELNFETPRARYEVLRPPRKVKIN
jgi:hypothetical protein